MFGQVSHETEVNVAASDAWELYGTIQLANLVREELPHMIEKVELLQGDGGVGTLFKLTYVPGTPGLSIFTEKLTKIDNENRIKEAEIIEGGYLDIGFTLYRFRLEIIEKSKDSCIIKSTIQYDVKEEAAANASFITIQPLASIAQVAVDYLIKNKTQAANP